MARRRFFVEKVEGGRTVVRGEEAHHLFRVLRVKPGQSFELTDTRRLYLGRVIATEPSAVEFAVEQKLSPGPPLPKVTLLAAIFKFDRLEWMIEKACELGAAEIVPVVASRTEPALAKAAGKRVGRWRRIALQAAQQSRRLAPPGIAAPRPLERALKEAPARTRARVRSRAAGGPGRRLDGK